MKQSQTCNVVNLGIVPYREALEIQQQITSARALKQIPDTLLILEHPHTYTLGKSGNRQHLLLTAEECHDKGITVIDADRGGDITYHGPGQIVIYPIRYLGRIETATTGEFPRLPHADYVGYIRRLEEVIIQTLAAFSIQAYRKEGYTGVWVTLASGPAKIAAIGVRVNAQGISSHGAALNITTDLSYFNGIVPCGVTEYPVTSIQAILGSAPPVQTIIIKQLVSTFQKVFDYQQACTKSLEELSLSGSLNDKVNI